MVSYRLEFKPSAERELRKLPSIVVARVSGVIDSLVVNPFPAHSVKLAGSINAYRIRVGDYRIVYTVENKVLLITVIRVRHRKEAYRKQ